MTARGSQGNVNLTLLNTNYWLCSSYEKLKLPSDTFMVWCSETVKKVNEYITFTFTLQSRPAPNMRAKVSIFKIYGLACFNNRATIVKKMKSWEDSTSTEHCNSELRWEFKWGFQSIRCRYLGPIWLALLMRCCNPWALCSERRSYSSRLWLQL